MRKITLVFARFLIGALAVSVAGYDFQHALNFIRFVGFDYFVLQTIIRDDLLSYLMVASLAANFILIGRKKGVA